MRGWQSILSSLLLAALILLCAAASAARLPVELQQALTNAGRDERLPVIVTYRVRQSGFASQATGTKPARRSRNSVITQMRIEGEANSEPVMLQMTQLGMNGVRRLWIANAIAAEATAAQLELLARNPEVSDIRLDSRIFAPMPMAGEPVPAEWNIDAAGAPGLWSMGYRGRGSVVAILDTGVDFEHPDLAARWRGGSNSWFDPYAEHDVPVDPTGHGTQVAGLLVGGDSSGTAVGMAPEAQWIAAKIFDDTGMATESAVHEAFQWLLDPDGDPDTDDAPDVVNNSWAIADEGICNSVFQADISALRAAGIAVVFSAGNFGPDSGSDTSPGNNREVSSVGALDSDLQVPLYSSRGPSTCDGSILPRFAAPGDSVLTTDLSFGGQPYYLLVSGTSYAAPHVSGAIALLRGASPAATVDEIEAALLTTTLDLGNPGPDIDTGYGLIDPATALSLLPIPADNDGDGFNEIDDCDDGDPHVYPNAPERVKDGIDQDCNGYDLTIDKKYAVYSHDGSTLRMRVTSRLDEAAALEIVGLGPMNWRDVYGDWIYDGPAGAIQKRLTITGIEGSLRIKPRPPTLKER